jgi:hypothetical protein
VIVFVVLGGVFARVCIVLFELTFIFVTKGLRATCFCNKEFVFLLAKIYIYIYIYIYIFFFFFF